MQFGLIIGTLAWFIWKRVPPRAVVVCAILGGAFVSYNISVYRSAMHDASLFGGGKGANLSELEQMKEVTDKGTEMRNAVYYIAATETLGAYDFGLFQWNQLIFRNFPAQIFGRSAKENLMSLGGLLHLGANAERASGYEAALGTTTGGITDAFASFWYFGCLEFFVIGYFMRRFYESAVRGAPVWQLGCALLTVDSLLAITHTTDHALTPWVQAGLFLGPTLIYARVRPGEGKRDIISAAPASNGTSFRVGARYPAWHDVGTGRGVRKFSARLPRSETRLWILASRVGRKRLWRRLPERQLWSRLAWNRQSQRSETHIGVKNEA